MDRLDAKLLAQLLDRHASALKLYAVGWCNEPDDVVQQAFIDLAACRALPDNPVAWLFAAVRRRAISQSRSESRRKSRERTAAVQRQKRSRDVDETAQTAADMLAELPIDDREIVIAHLWGRLTFREIAQLTSTSSSTTQRRYESAIARLQERMNPSCPKPKA
jgi:RNA polymerase sigma factor (sigma-70 family)